MIKDKNIEFELSKLQKKIDKKSVTTITKKVTNVTNQSIQPETVLGKPIVPNMVPSDGQVLIYNKDKGQWEPGTLETGGSFSGTMDDIANGTTYVKTENNLTDALVSTIESALQSETSHETVLVDDDIGSIVQAFSPYTVIDQYYVHTDNNFTDALETKLNGLENSSGLTQPQIMARSLGC